jgi:cell division protein FtsB
MSEWFEQRFRDAPWRLQRQAVALVALGLFIALVTGALYLAQSASVATLGRQLEELITRRNQLEQTNEQLRSEIAQLRSVPRLLARAQELGFQAAEESSIEYLYVDGYNPNREAAQVVAAAPPQPAPVYDETFIGWLQQVWNDFSQQLSGYSSEVP